MKTLNNTILQIIIIQLIFVALPKFSLAKEEAVTDLQNSFEFIADVNTSQTSMEAFVLPFTKEMYVNIKDESDIRIYKDTANGPKEVPFFIEDAPRYINVKELPIVDYTNLNEIQKTTVHNNRKEKADKNKAPLLPTSKNSLPITYVLKTDYDFNSSDNWEDKEIKLYIKSIKNVISPVAIYGSNSPNTGFISLNVKKVWYDDRNTYAALFTQDYPYKFLKVELASKGYEKKRSTKGGVYLDETKKIDFVNDLSFHISLPVDYNLTHFTPKYSSKEIRDDETGFTYTDILVDLEEYRTHKSINFNLKFSDENFDRRVAIYTSNNKDSKIPKKEHQSGSNYWKKITEQNMHKTTDNTFGKKNTELYLKNRDEKRYVLIRIYNDNNEPLKLTDLKSKIDDIKSIYFKNMGAGKYSIFFGTDHNTKKPKYDFKKLLDSKDVFILASGVKNENVRKNPNYNPPKVPFLERSKLILPLSLLMVALILMFLLFQAFKQQNNTNH